MQPPAGAAGAEHAAATHRRSPDAGRPRPDVARNSEEPRQRPRLGPGPALGQPAAPVYGSAWKEDQTATNVVDAVLAGFRGVDTACQPQHYREDLVGEALRTLAAEHGIGREAVWLQTKFTPALHQGADVPYDPAAPLSDQVAQSVQVSLKNLQVTSVDALLLHGPLETHERTMEAWRAMERQVELGFVTQLGISNLHDVRRFERILRRPRSSRACSRTASRRTGRDPRRSFRPRRRDVAPSRRS